MSALVRVLGPLLYVGSRFTDPIDGRSYRKFLPYGYGGRIRENALSPGTNSLERHRLLYLYLQNYTEFFTAPLTVLHIAPEQCFHQRFKTQPNQQVLTADIESPLADMHIDLHQSLLTNLQQHNGVRVDLPCFVYMFLLFVPIFHSRMIIEPSEKS